VYAGGAALSLLTGAIGDFVIIGITLLANVTVGVWQEQKANRVSEALQRIGTSTANVLREGQSITIPADEVVLGDILLLIAGDRIAADARVFSAHGLEVDEASLTGESVPVARMPSGGTDASRIVLQGSDVTTGSGRAIVVAVGAQTRMGATAAALSVDMMEQSPLGVRLNSMLRVLLPLSIAGGGIVIGSGLLQRRPIASQLALGVTMFLAAFPEGLPLLASVGEAGVARRLASRNAVVRRLTAVEALGRVDVACTDKTGTLTEGKLALSLVADDTEEAKMPAEALSPDLHRVLLAAALASPHPHAPGARAHPTDVAIVQGAMAAGLGQQLYAEHERELPFDPVRSFHATVAQGHLYVKGAPESLLPRCSWAIEHGEKHPMDEQRQQQWAIRAEHFAAQGLRLLMVAVGPPDMPLNNPQELTALGFVGISDPLRPNVQAAVQRCHEAGVRVIMITGDHPATARTIARETGLLNADGAVFTGPEILALPNGELEECLERATVIARATPLDKLRIIEGLRRHGHTVAMTGDGVNDAPALRLADVGVAMGLAGTEVARQVADVVLADDDFSTLVEALLEGRSYWRNIRRALSLLLGGNLGELALIVAASLLGNYPLTARQILAMNVITDLLPALAVILQQPEHRSLAGLNREGEAALGKPLRADIFRRAITCAAPSLASYLIMLRVSALPQARSVAFASIIGTQLAQTLDAGRAEGRLTSSVVGAVGGSAAMLAATLAIPPLRNFLNLALPGPSGWILSGAASLLAVLLNRALSPPSLMNLFNGIPQNGGAVGA
jgi:calcium-translocating P-type ATPase